jgi:hypothetical protein
MTKIFHPLLALIASATDTEICESINRWRENLGHDDGPLSSLGLPAIRVEMRILPSSRKPFPKRLFEREESGTW